MTPQTQFTTDRKYLFQLGLHSGVTQAWQQVSRAWVFYKAKVSFDSCAMGWGWRDFIKARCLTDAKWLTGGASTQVGSLSETKIS